MKAQTDVENQVEAESTASSGAEGWQRLFVYTDEELQYAIPIMSVVEIVSVEELLQKASNIPGCLGNIAHRDLLVPILGSSILAGVEEAARAVEKTPGWVIVVKQEEVCFALTIDSFLEVVSLPADGRYAAAEPSEGVDRSDEGQIHSSFVTSVRAFRDNSLITFSPETIAASVKRYVLNQTLLQGDENERGDDSPLDGIETESFLTARIDRFFIGVPIRDVLEVIEGYDVTPLFRVPRCLRGLINLRGQVLACVDISDKLGLPNRQVEETNQFLVLQGEGTELALWVDKVVGIRALSIDSMQSAESVLTGNLTEYITGVVVEEGDTVFILSVERVFDSPDLHEVMNQT